ncbi:MAG: hypothetical protein JNN00_10865 [Chitinophagaceae bacterium]|nr:hypothetical protein [Chitinophagaceae bacterium]
MIYILRLVLIVNIVCSGYAGLLAQGKSNSIVSGFAERKEKAITALKSFAKPDTARINALFNVISVAFIQKQRQELLPYYEEAMALSRKLEYAEGLAKCYVWKGHFNKAAPDRPAAHLYYDSAIVLARGTSNDGLLRYKADAHRGKGMIYYEQENYYNALNQFFESLKYYETRNSYTAMLLYTVIANVYARVNNYQQATVYALKNVALAEKDSSKAMQSQAYLSLAEIYVRKNELALAEIYLDKMKPNMPDPAELMVNTVYYLSRGQVHYLQHEYDSSLFYYQQAYAIASGSGHNSNITASLFYLSSSALRSGKLLLAKKYAEENLAAAERTGARIGKINALLNLSDYYHETGNNNKAFDLLQQAAGLKDSLLAETNINQINTLAAVYEADKKEKEIIQLQNEKEIQASAVKQKSILNIVFIVSITALLILGYLVYKNFKKGQQIASQRQTLQQQKIIELEKDRQLLTIDAMLKGQEEERSRIAKDLHDGLGGLLSGTKLSFMNVKESLSLSGENSVLFDRSLSMLDNTIGDLRKVAQNLMPEALVKFGLHEAVRDFCDAIQSSSGKKVLYHELGEKRKLDNTAEVFAYRIIQELVNNAVKHAEAGLIMVQVSMNGDTTRITVEDNGKGFDKNNLSRAKGAGMANISYRVQYFNGIVDIVTSPGNGTSVNVELIA